MHIKDLVFEWLDQQPNRHILAHAPSELKDKYNEYQTDSEKLLSDRHARRVAKQYREENQPAQPVEQPATNYVVDDGTYHWDTVLNENTIHHELDVSIVDHIFLDYNFYGGKQSRAQLSAKYGLSNAEWSFLYGQLGLRQKGALLSPHTLANVDNKEEFLVQTLKTYQNSINQQDITQRAATQALHAKLKRQTKKFDNTEQREQQLMGHIIESLHDASFNYTPPYKVTKNYKTIEDRYALVLPLYDLHIGKNTVAFSSSEEYNHEIAKERLIHHTQNLVAQASVYNITEIHTTVGSDQFHFDTESATTTSGTPVGDRETVYESIRFGYDLTLDFIYLLKTLDIPITINYVRGNHDALVGFGMLLFLNGYFHNDPQVTVKVQGDPYVYEQYGNNLIAFHHGDGVRKANLTKLLAQKARKVWGETEHTYVFLGHLHHVESVDDYGTILYQVPALCGKDTWHNLKGYHSSKGFMGFLLHETKGLTQIFNQKPPSY